MYSIASSNSIVGRPIAAPAGQTFSAKKLANASEVRAYAQSETTVSVSKEALLKSLGDRYDPRAMSTSEVKAMAREMRDGGLLSEWEYASMTIELRLPGQEYDSKSKTDLISQYTAQIEYTKTILSKPGMKEQMASLEKIRDYFLNISGKLNTA